METMCSYVIYNEWEFRNTLYYRRTVYYNQDYSSMKSLTREWSIAKQKLGNLKTFGKLKHPNVCTTYDLCTM